MYHQAPSSYQVRLVNWPYNNPSGQGKPILEYIDTLLDMFESVPPGFMDVLQARPEYTNLFKEVLTLLKGGITRAGSVECFDNTINEEAVQTVLFKTYGQLMVYQNAQPFDSTEGTSLHVRPCNDPQIMGVLRTLNAKCRDWVRRVNAMYAFIDGEKAKLNLGFKSLLKASSSDLILHIPMVKYHNEYTKAQVSYPYTSLFDLSTSKCVYLNGLPHYIPRLFSRDSVEGKNIHKLFGQGSIIKSYLRVDWKLANGTFKLSLKVCPDQALVLPRPSNNTRDLLKGK